MKFFPTALTFTALFFAPLLQAHAATPAQAARAAACQVPADAITTSLEKQPLLDRFEAEAAYVSRAPGRPVQIIEFFDYSCPTCRALAPTLKTLHTRFETVRVDLVDFPLWADTFVSIVTGNKTGDASLIGVAAMDQGRAKYLAFHDALISIKGRVTAKQIERAAQTAGIDLDQARIRAASSDVARRVAANKAFASALGLAGTPGLIVDGIIVPINAETGATVSCLVEAAHDAALKSQLSKAHSAQ